MADRPQARNAAWRPCSLACLPPHQSDVNRPSPSARLPPLHSTRFLSLSSVSFSCPFRSPWPGAHSCRRSLLQPLHLSIPWRPRCSSSAIHRWSAAAHRYGRPPPAASVVRQCRPDARLLRHCCCLQLGPARARRGHSWPRLGQAALLRCRRHGILWPKSPSPTSSPAVFCDQGPRAQIRRRSRA
jgi:hypothetical protein